MMRSRSNSGVRLDNYARMVHKTILCHQVRKNPFFVCWTGDLHASELTCSSHVNLQSYKRFFICFIRMVDHTKVKYLLLNVAAIPV